MSVKGWAPWKGRGPVKKTWAAYHEAGHTLMRLHRPELSLGRAYLKHVEAGDRWLGERGDRPGWVGRSCPVRKGRVPSDSMIWLDLSGPVAETIYRRGRWAPYRVDGWGEECDQAIEIIGRLFGPFESDEMRDLWATYLRCVQDTLYIHWWEVRAIAEALIEREHLSAREVREIVASVPLPRENGQRMRLVKWEIDRDLVDDHSTMGRVLLVRHGDRYSVVPLVEYEMEFMLHSTEMEMEPVQWKPYFTIEGRSNG